MADSDQSIKLLGFGIPLDDLTQGTSKDRFRNAFEGDSKEYDPSLMMTREMTMIKLMDEASDRHDWANKALTTTEEEFKKKLHVCCHLTEKMLSWCWKELQQKAQHFLETKITCAIDHGVFKTDVQDDTDLTGRCQLALSGFEKMARLHKDLLTYGNNPKTVGGLNLVNPSLFPLIFGRSRILPEGTVPLSECLQHCGKGCVIPAPTFKSLFAETWRYEDDEDGLMASEYYSPVYQWLPSEVTFDAGGSPKVVSYINNVHPARVGVYSVIEELIERSIPMWDYTLTALDKQSSVGRLGRRFRWKKLSKEESEARNALINAHMSQCLKDPMMVPDDDILDGHEDRDLVLPDPVEFHTSKLPHYMKGSPGNPAENHNDKPSDKVVNLRDEFKSLQVVVKVFSILLTPENPEYDADLLHVEGHPNEHIVASSLYVYSTSNTIENRLRFQTRVAGFHRPGREGHCGYSMYYNLEEDDPAIQELGSVLVREGRLITYHNGLYSCMDAVRLADSSKRGHRKYIMIYLVDPNVKIISTANVPPQRKDWWKDQLVDSTSRFGQLPQETFDQIVSSVDEFPISMQEAKKTRIKMDKERQAFVCGRIEALYERTMDLSDPASEWDDEDEEELIDLGQAA